jgi:hypothetical protein
MWSVALLDIAPTAEFDKEAASILELQKKELELWNKWNEGGQRPDDLRPLLKSLRPLIRSKSNFWANRADLPPAAVHAEFNKRALGALRTYNPTKGTQLKSWVTTNLKKAQRWVSSYQDPTRMQETRYYKAGQWDNAKATLDEQLNREPTTLEMAEFLGWPEAEAGRMEAEKRDVFYTSLSPDGFDPTSIMPSREVEVLNLIRPELNPEETLVYEHTIGFGGKPQLRPGEIAKKLRMSPSKVTRIRNAITKKIERYL